MSFNKYVLQLEYLIFLCKFISIIGQYHSEWLVIVRDFFVNILHTVKKSLQHLKIHLKKIYVF